MTTEFTPDEAEENLAPSLDKVFPTRGDGNIPVVGIGASHTALPQVRQLLAGVPEKSGLAFVVLRHAKADSVAEDWGAAMQGFTSWRVVDAKHSVKLEKDTVYIVPQKRGARALEGKLVITDGEPEHGRRVVDLFLRSMADTHGSQAAGIVLSGPGADGAIGIKRVKERGG